MSDRIGVLLGGRLKQFDTPKKIYFNSASPEVATFLGPVNAIPERLFALFGVNGHPSGRIQSRTLMARPENLDMVPQSDGPGRIAEKTFAGHYTAYIVNLQGAAYTVYSQDDRFEPGQRVLLKLKPD